MHGLLRTKTTLTEDRPKLAEHDRVLSPLDAKDSSRAGIHFQFGEICLDDLPVLQPRTEIRP
ncbi:MAG: hypothetical protein Kow0074_11970 [Candidatus Zixiibacteriota bacterium]